MIPLSYRERQVVRLRRKGLLHKQIAYRLELSLSAVRNYLDRAQAKGARLKRIKSWKGVR